MNVRTALAWDAAAIAKLDVASWRVAYRGIMPEAYLDGLSVTEKTQEWEASLSRYEPGSKRTLVAENPGGAIAGFVTVGPGENPGIGLVYLLYVAPDAWRQGVGTLLMSGALNTLTEQGLEAAELWVLERNARARSFYEVAGWLEDGATQVIDYAGAKLTALRYHLRAWADATNS